MEPELKAIVDPLKQEVRDHGLWATQLGPDLGGQGYGQLKLALLHEVIGITNWGASIFGTMAPDTGNAEILAAYGTEDQKSEYLQPLLGGDIVSCFAMTEPLGGADPSQFTTQAVRDGEEWVITGDKYWASHARWAEFLIVMAVTDPDAPLTNRMSMFIVPKDTPGMTFVHQTGLWGDAPEDGAHALIEFRGARVPADSILGRPGEAFAVSQTRLGGGRLHAAMRAIGSCQKAIDMMAERALSRRTKGELLADKQAVQMDIANSTRSWRRSGCTCSTRLGSTTRPTTGGRSARTSRRSRSWSARSSTTSPAGRCTCTGPWASATSSRSCRSCTAARSRR